MGFHTKQIHSSAHLQHGCLFLVHLPVIAPQEHLPAIAPQEHLPAIASVSDHAARGPVMFMTATHGPTRSLNEMT